MLPAIDTCGSNMLMGGTCSERRSRLYMNAPLMPLQTWIRAFWVRQQCIHVFSVRWREGEKVMLTYSY